MAFVHGGKCRVPRKRMAAHVDAVAPGELDDRMGVGKAELSSLGLYGRPFQRAFRLARSIGRRSVSAATRRP
jgi:hypothetical protein